MFTPAAAYASVTVSRFRPRIATPYALFSRFVETSRRTATAATHAHFVTSSCLKGPLRMKINVSAENPLRAAADALVIPVFSDGDVTDAVVSVDKPLGGLIKDMYRAGEIKGREDELHVLPASKKLKAKRVIIVGLGPAAKRTAAAMSRFAGAAVRLAQRRGLRSLAFLMPELKGVDLAEAGELFAEG